MFKGILLTKTENGVQAALAGLDETQLPPGDVLLRVECSTINYKDALAITNKAPVVRSWPMVAGIDGAGRVEESAHEAWRPGDRVILNGWGVGETHWGCLAQRARLRGDWLVAMPGGLDAATAMAIGTAGYTAMLCVMALEEQGVRPDAGEVLVTGGAGGVGGTAIALLSGLGYTVTASTGRTQEADYLRQLGAHEVVDRSTLSQPGKPLQKERWAAVVDSVGSHTLVNACAQTRYHGVVAACGLAQGMDFPATVAPFILRGVRLIGVDSVMVPLAERQRAWARLATSLDRAKLASMTKRIGLGEVIDHARALLEGRVRGRVVVDVDQ